MLQTYDTQAPYVVDQSAGDGLDISRYVAIAKRRALYFLIPFLVLLALGLFVVAIQRPIYHAEGKILIESQDIPTDLVRPTVNSAAGERIQVIQQRLMTRDNLLAIINKFGLFPSERRWMSTTQLIDLMRERAIMEMTEVNLASRQNSISIAFKVSFEYDSPDLAAKVAGELMTLILAEDARTRTNRAVETTKFLDREAKRLQGELIAVDARIAELKQKPSAVIPPSATVSEQVKAQVTALNALRADLIDKSSTYSNSHPTVVALRKKIAALEKAIAHPPAAAVAPPPPPSAAVSPSSSPAELENALDVLQRQRLIAEKNLDDANQKLRIARLGESLERDQQSERLQVLEQPTVPQKPVRPNRAKLAGIAIAFAAFVGFASAGATEALDGTVRSRYDVNKLIDPALVVTIPYIFTARERARRRRKTIIVCVVLVIALLAGGAMALLFGPSVDLSWMDRSWLDSLTRLTK